MSQTDTLSLICGSMRLGLDRQRGVLVSLKVDGDPYDTNFLGGPENIASGKLPGALFTGDLVSRVWVEEQPRRATIFFRMDSYPVEPVGYAGSWQVERTSCSDDIRQVEGDERSLRVTYNGKSSQPHGIQSYRLEIRYTAQSDGALLAEYEITNPGSQPLELGELGLPLTVNNDYPALWGGEDETVVTVEGRSWEKQKLVHEKCVTVHNFVAGHSSYSLVQRPLGDTPFLLIQTIEDTAFEAVYKPDPSERHWTAWEGPDILAMHTWAVYNEQHWPRHWINGCTSLVLAPGETRTWKLRFSLIESYEAIRRELYENGNLGIRPIPGMVIPEDGQAQVEVWSRSELDRIELLSDGVQILDQRRQADKNLLTLKFHGHGQKTLRLHYAGQRWTNLHFFCTEPFDQLLKARARFIIDRQFWNDPDEPFRRYHMFLPFDDHIGSIFFEADEVWEVGGSDEFGFSEPLFLAYKNLFYPDRAEVETLEAYVADCLYGVIQDRETFTIQASLYWKERTPSSPWSHWHQERAARSYRTYNYPHTVNIYYALYLIGKYYGLGQVEPLEYLRRAFRAAIQWFQTGPWKNVGVMGGANVIRVLEALRVEGWDLEAESLQAEMETCNQEFLRDPYPYGSELFTDQTAHEQVYFFTRFFNSQAKNQKTLQVMKALRGGDQPAWFWYGNDKRWTMACWYSESLVGWAVLQGYEDTRDEDLLRKGYAGVLSVMANMRADGIGFGWFNYDPTVFAHRPPRTLDNGIGQFGFMQSAKSYVVEDAVFGWTGYGCTVQREGDLLKIRPWDGLRKRLSVQGLPDLTLLTGEIELAVCDLARRTMTLHLVDSTGFVQAPILQACGKGALLVTNLEGSIVLGIEPTALPVHLPGIVEIQIN